LTFTAAASDRMMPSLTAVSSDTDICFSPGLFGLLCRQLATGGVPDSFQDGHVQFLRRSPHSCSHTA
jgi:hypothetical protein